MDKYRPKRPTTLALFPQLPQTGTQDSINNNSLGKKDSWTEACSSSPHITGDLALLDAQPKAGDKVQHSTRRPAPKPPTANGTKGRAGSQAAATVAESARVLERHAASTQPPSTPRSQRRGGGRGLGKGASAMRDRSLGDSKGRNGVTAVKEERRGGRLCEAKEKDREALQRTRESNALKSRGADRKGKGGAKATNRSGLKQNNFMCSQEVYLTAMVVPRTPVAPRNQDKPPDPGQNHDGTQDHPPVLSRSSSEGGSNRMSLSSDTEGPPPGPLHPSLSHRMNPDISEEEGEGENGPNHGPVAVDGTTPAEGDLDTDSYTQGDSVAVGTVAKSESAAGLNYDSVKYTLVVDEHAQLELVSLKNCMHGYEHNGDSDTETVYQSANEEEDPEYEEERKRREQTRKQERRKEDETRKWREEDVKRRREEEVKRRREVVARICKQTKVMSTTTSEEDDSGGKAAAPRSKKFLNLFASSSYSATGAESFGVFSCVLHGVEQQQSHRAVYRFVPRHADELYLEADDPVLMLSQSEDLWCQGYNMRTGASGIFPAFYAVQVPKDMNQGPRDACMEQFLVRFLGSVQVPIHKGNDVLCAAMQKVVCNRRLAAQPPPVCVLEVSVDGVKISVQDQCHSANRGDQCFHFFQLKNISFCGCHPKHSKYFGFITKHPDQQRFACHVLVSETTLHPLAQCVGRAFQQYYKQHVGYSCPTEDIFIE